MLPLKFLKKPLFVHTMYKIDEMFLSRFNTLHFAFLQLVRCQKHYICHIIKNLKISKMYCILTIISYFKNFKTIRKVLSDTLTIINNGFKIINFLKL